MHKQALDVIHRQRDSIIIQRSVELVPEVRQRLGADLLNDLTEPHLGPHEAFWILGGTDWDIPVVYGLRKETADRVLADPETSGQNLSVSDSLLSEWTNFQSMLLRESLLSIEERQQTTYLLARAAVEFRQKYGGRKTQEFVERLWKHRWIYDAWVCANLLWDVVGGIPGSPFKSERHLHEGEWAYQKILALLGRAKDNASDLNDWFEELYLLSPWLKYAALAFRKSESPDASKYLRWLDEAMADVHSAWLTGVLKLQTLMWKTPYYWSFAPSVQMVDNANRNTVLRHLSFGYNARIKYPKFWYQAAAEHVRNQSPPPNSLGEFTPKRLVSIYITYAPRLTLRVLSGTVAQFEGGR